MRNSAVVCFVLAVLSTLVGINVVRAAGEELVVGRIVGIFLLPMLFLIAGLKLAQKPKE